MKKRHATWIAIPLIALILAGARSCTCDKSEQPEWWILSLLQSGEQKPDGEPAGKDPTIVVVGRWNQFYVSRRTEAGFEFTLRVPWFPGITA